MPPMEPSPLAQSDEELSKALEGLLFITDRPLSIEQLGKIVGVKDPARVGALVEQLRQKLEEKGSPVVLLEVAEGFQMATRPAYAPYVRKLFADKMTMRLSTAAHETLSIVAYKQPLTRAEIEEIRGVEVIAALETLLEKRLIKVVGRKESVGRPLMYGTTAEFLRHFGLRSLEDLPPLEQFKTDLPAQPEAEPAGQDSAVSTASVETDAVVEPAAVAVSEAAPMETEPESEKPAE